MGEMEERSGKRARRENLKNLILGSVALAGAVGVALVAPNVLGAMAKLGIIPRKRHREGINRARDRLLKQGLLTREGGLLRISTKGEAALRRLQLWEYGAKKPRQWDGKWRALIFDIPEYRKGLREKVRRSLMAIGFERLQDSVWVYPYDCEDFVALLKADFKIGRDMRYLIIDEIEGDGSLRRSFGLRNP